MRNEKIPILAIGDYAAELLLPDSEGKIYAATSKVTYLQHDLEELIWIVRGDTPMHRRAIQIADPLPEVSLNSSYAIEDKTLVFESGILLDLHHDQPWRPLPISRSEVLPIQDLEEKVQSFSSLIENLPSYTGFGIFIPHILNLIHDQSAIPSGLRSEWSTLQKIAWPKIDEIAKACLAQDLDEILSHAEELIGLGEGLTPSGDDFVGGLFFCIRILQYVFGILNLATLDALTGSIDKWGTKTNQISFTILQDHAHGHAIETLHSLANSLLTEEDLDNLAISVSDLSQVGQSTGWDILTGFLTGFLILKDFIPDIGPQPPDAKS